MKVFTITWKKHAYFKRQKCGILCHWIDSKREILSLSSNFSEYWHVQGIFLFKPSNWPEELHSHSSSVVIFWKRRDDSHAKKKKAWSIRSSVPLDKSIVILKYFKILKYCNIEIFQNTFIPRFKSSCCFASELDESTDVALLTGLFICTKYELNQSCWNIFVLFFHPLPTLIHTEQIFRNRLCSFLQEKGIVIG